MRFALLTLATLLATACGATTAAPAPANPTTAPAAASAPSTPAPTAQSDPPTARPALPTATSGAAAAPATTAAPAISSATGATTLVLDATSSKASYRAREQLVGRDLPSDAVGTTNGVSGTIVLNSDGSVDPAQSQIKVDLSKLASDESRRDNFIRGNTLQTSQFPMATFTPRSVQGLPTPLPSSGEATFQMSGDLTVHGVTKPVTWQVAAQFGSDNVSGSATTDVNISDFGMTPPKAGPVLSIQDGVTLELAFTASREA